ncbi:MAG: response regulator [Candidatus Bathyarchaeales archaeon]
MKRKTSILVVDDDESICKTLGLILEGRGYNVDVAYSGEKAIEKSRAKAYNIAILDIVLPDIQGTELLKALQETTPKMIKIMLTGYPKLDNAIEALNYDAEAYLTKPVNPENLIKVIEEKLEKQRREEIMTVKRIEAFVKTRTQRLLEEME